MGEGPALHLPMNVKKTRCRRLPEEPMTFLGYRIGRNYRLETGAPQGRRRTTEAPA